MTWSFVQVGLDKLSFNKLQSQAVVPAGQTSLVISSYLHQNIFDQQRPGQTGMPIPNLPKAMFVICNPKKHPVRQ